MSNLPNKIKIIVFDMDGVLVNIKSSWTIIHNEFNVDERETFRRYLRGEFDYLEFMRKDIESTCWWT